MLRCADSSCFQLRRHLLLFGLAFALDVPAVAREIWDVQLALLEKAIQLYWHLSLSPTTLQTHVKYCVGLCISHTSQAPDRPLPTAEVLANSVSCVVEK